MIRGCCSQPCSPCKRSLTAGRGAGPWSGDAGQEGQTCSCHRAPGTAAVLPWCYSKHPEGVQHPPSRISGAWTREGASRAQDVSRMEPFTAAKLSPWQERNRHQNTQEKVDNPHKPQFLSAPHENAHVAGGKLNKRKKKALNCACCSRRSCC